MELEGGRYMRFDKVDKKEIARAKDQYAYERDLMGDSRFMGYRCRRCNRVFTRLSDFEVDHIKPRSRRGSDRPSNLQLLCRECNRRKSDKPWRKTTTVKRKTSTVKRKTSTVKRKTKTVKRKTSTTKRKQRAVKKKASTVKRKTTTAKRKSSTVKRKRATTRGKSSSARRRGR
jgi:5-methylcytosine-specific restriction endonuclease McrA